MGNLSALREESDSFAFMRDNVLKLSLRMNRILKDQRKEVEAGGVEPPSLSRQPTTNYMLSQPKIFYGTVTG